MKLNNFYYAYNLLEMLYGLEVSEEDFEEIGLLAWNQIGNRRCRIYRATLCLDPCDTSVELPCNCDILEAVTAPFEDFQQVSNKYDRSVPGSFTTEEYIENTKHFKHPLYISGKYIPYTQIGNTIHLQEHFDKINILYRGIELDNEGLPELTDKEANAIAAFVAYTVKFKDALRTGNKLSAEAANLMKMEWLKLCDRARIPDYINQNEWDEILDAKNNWSRKIFNKTYKPLK